MASFKHAFQLCQALRKSGTGEGKLAILRDLLTRKPTASAEEGIQHLIASGRCVPETIAKARHLIDHGTPPPPKNENERPKLIEDELSIYAATADVEKRMRSVTADPDKILVEKNRVEAELRDKFEAEFAEKEKAVKDAFAKRESDMKAELDKIKADAETKIADERAKFEAERAAGPGPQTNPPTMPPANGAGKAGNKPK